APISLIVCSIELGKSSTTVKMANVTPACEYALTSSSGPTAICTAENGASGAVVSTTIERLYKSVKLEPDILSPLNSQSTTRRVSVVAFQQHMHIGHIGN